jgi:U3 small nucleolar RNA-associated protein 3
MLQASKALNLSLYLLLKADQASNSSASADSSALFMDDDVVDDVRNHPVIDRLNLLSQLTDKLEKVEDNTSGLREQLSNLVKAATLVDGGDVSSSDDDSEVDVVDNDDASDDEEGSELGAAIEEQRDLADEGAESSSDSEAEENEEAIQRRVMTEARFALRNQDLEQDNAASKTSKRKRRLAPSSYDYGDETEELTEKAVQAGRKLASTMNSISQKSATSSQKKNSQVGDEVERDEDEYEQLQRGLSMMEEEFGGGGSDEDGDGDSIGDEEGFGDDDDDDDGFYQKIKSKSMAKKKAKKQMYAVAPKYPRLDNEVEGERTIGRTIMKNRGLVAHKPKINRNPRVKKREQYRKALIRRKGAVREIRKDEGHVYGGETTGIKSGISRSRKL